MHVGVATIFQNPGRACPDREVYREDLRLADLVEPLGFDSIWGVEHHFSYAGMPGEEAERSLRLFASEGLPALRALDAAPAAATA